MTTDINRPARGRAAARIRDGLRQLNEAADDYANPPEMYGELTVLTQIAHESATALDQASRWLQAEHEAGRITTDSGEDRDSAPAAIDALIAARDKMEAAAAALDSAAGHARYLAPVTGEDGHDGLGPNSRS